MRSILILFVLVSICGLGAQTLEDAGQPASNFFDSYTLSSSASLGFLYGQSEELVYEDGKRLSQLLWDMKPLFYWGAALEFSRLNPVRQWGPFAALSFRFGFPGRTGVMEDRDWQTKRYGLPDGTLTDFSSHDNYTQRATLADASIGISVPITSSFASRHYIAYSYMFFAWNGQDGYGDYPYSIGHQVYSGAVINYSQTWHIALYGIALNYSFFRVFSVSAALQVGTVVSYSAVDEHLTTYTQYNDTASGGVLHEPRFEFTWSPLNKLSVSLNAGYRRISVLKGTSVAGNNPNKTPIGAAYSVWDAGLSVKVCF